MKTFYHINHSNWKTADEITVGLEDNNYWKSLSNDSETFEFDGESHEAFKVLNAALEHYTKTNHAPSIIKGYHFNPLNTLHESIQCLRNSINVNRELIFEQVRKETFPNLPSRQKSIWLIPNNHQSIKFWNKILNQDNSKHIYELEIIEGTTHRGSHEWLNGGTFSINQWKAKAQNYWNEINAGEIDDEVLFEGTFKIKNIA